MSQAMPDVDPLAPSRPAASFKDAPVGYFIEGHVDELPALRQSRDFDTGEMAVWPDGNPKMSVVVGIQQLNGAGPCAFWASKPSSMLTALQHAQQAAGKRIELGGILRVTYVGSVPNTKNPRLNDIKQYTAVYTPPAPEDLIGAPPTNGAPPAQAYAPPPQQQYAPPAPPAYAPPPQQAYAPPPPAQYAPPPPPVAPQPPTMTKPPAAPPPPASVEVPPAVKMQLASFINAQMTNEQILGVPTMAAAGVTEALIEQIRAQGPV